MYPLFNDENEDFKKLGFWSASKERKPEELFKLFLKVHADFENTEWDVIYNYDENQSTTLLCNALVLHTIREYMIGHLCEILRKQLEVK